MINNTKTTKQDLKTLNASIYRSPFDSLPDQQYNETSFFHDKM